MLTHTLSEGTVRQDVNPRVVVRKLRSALASLGFAKRDGRVVSVNECFDDDFDFMVSRFKERFGVPNASFEIERDRREVLRRIFRLLQKYGFEGGGGDDADSITGALFSLSGPLSEKQALKMTPAFSRAIEDLRFAWLNHTRITEALLRKAGKDAVQSPTPIEDAFFDGIEALVSPGSELESESDPDPVLA